MVEQMECNECNKYSLHGKLLSTTQTNTRIRVYLTVVSCEDNLISVTSPSKASHIQTINSIPLDGPQLTTILLEKIERSL